MPEPALVAPKPRYRDELNFAEFPIAALADTLPAGVKTLEFTDQVFDPSTGTTVPRTLVVTAADRFGLPTALDDEVLLGLIQLTAEQGFADRTVPFTRYGLIRLLGWRDESKSYRRVADALSRWAGVTLQYDRAWWSKAERGWVSETFHVLDRVTVFDRERLARRRAMAGSSGAGSSSFVWSEVVFDSFRAGYVKALDFDLYKALGGAVAKRVYRFLDKRFYHKGRWAFDLRAFACDKCGLSRNYTNAQLKRKLAPAVRELEGRGFLAPLPPAERFVPAGPGRWTAVFARATRPADPRPTAESDAPLVAELVARGLTKRTARTLVAEYPAARVREKVRLFDGLAVRGGAGAVRNPAGWLHAAVVHDFADPNEAVSNPAGTPPRPTPAPTARRVPAAAREAGGEGATADRAFDEFWAGLTESDRDAFERAAVAAAPPFLRKQYRDGQADRGSLWRAARDQALRAHFARTPVGSGSGCG